MPKVGKRIRGDNVRQQEQEGNVMHSREGKNHGEWDVKWTGNLWPLHSMVRSERITPKLMETRRDCNVRKPRLGVAVTSAKRLVTIFKGHFSAE